MPANVPRAEKKSQVKMRARLGARFYRKRGRCARGKRGTSSQPSRSHSPSLAREKRGGRLYRVSSCAIVRKELDRADRAR